MADATQDLDAARQRQQGTDRPVHQLHRQRSRNILVTIDREKAKSLHVPLSRLPTRLQVYMGSVYVNDFDFNNRSYRVYVQADQQFRSNAERHRPVLRALG